MFGRGQQFINRPVVSCCINMATRSYQNMRPLALLPCYLCWRLSCGGYLLRQPISGRFIRSDAAVYFQTSPSNSPKRGPSTSPARMRLRVVPLRKKVGPNSSGRGRRAEVAQVVEEAESKLLRLSLSRRHGVESGRVAFSRVRWMRSPWSPSGAAWRRRVCHKRHRTLLGYCVFCFSLMGLLASIRAVCASGFANPVQLGTAAWVHAV